MILYGSGMSDSQNHISRDLPVLVVGSGAGQIKDGRHLKFPAETPMTNPQLALIDKMGVPVERFGDSTGELNLLSGV